MTQFQIATSPIEPTYTPDQLREANANKPDRVGTLQLVKDAANSEFATSWFSRWAVGESMPSDPDFALDEDLVGELTQGLDPSLWGELTKAESLAHAYYIRETMLDVQASRERLQRSGVRGAALTFGAAFLDPAFLAGGALVEAGTAGLGTGAVAAQVAAKASRVRSALRGGLIATAADVPIQAFISSQDPEQGTREVLYTLAGGGALGGTLGAAFPRSLARAEHGAMTRLGRDTQAEELDGVLNAMGAAGAQEFRRPLERLRGVLTEKGRSYFRDQVDPEVRQQRVDNLIDSVFDDATADIAAGLKSMEPDDALAVMDRMQRTYHEGSGTGRRPDKLFPSGVKDEEGNALPPTPGKVTEHDFDASWAQGGVAKIDRLEVVGGEGGFVSAVAGTARSLPRQLSEKRLTDVLRFPTFDTQLGSVNDSATRVFGAASVKQNLLREGDAPIGLSAEEWTKQKSRGTLASYNRRMDAAHSNFNARRGKDGRLSRQDFANLVTQSFRSVATDPDPDVAAAVKTVREIRDFMLDGYKRHGVEGFEDVEADAFRIDRRWDPSKIHKLDQDYGSDYFNQLLRKAIAAEHPDLTDKKLDALSSGFAEIVRGLGKWSSAAQTAPFGVGDYEELSEALAVSLRRLLPESDVEQVLAEVRPRPEDAGKPSFAKRRLRLDENAPLGAPDGQSYTLQQVLESDMDAIMQNMVRQGFGAMASSEVYRAVGMHIDPDGGTKIRSWKQMRNILGQRLEEAGHTREQIDNILRTAEMTDRWVRGAPLRDKVAGERFWSRLRQIGFLNFSGGFGATQQIEWGNILGEANVRAVLLQMPELRAITKKGADGLLERRDMQIIEAMTGIGTDGVNSRMLDHFDYKTLENPIDTSVDRSLHGVARAASYANGMIPTLIAQKKATIVIATQTWLDVANSGKIPNKRRLATMNLTPDEARKLAAGVKEHARTTDTLLGEKFKELDLDTWLAVDPDTATKYINSLDKWSTRVVQEGDLGSMMPWTTAPWGRVITQFKQFVLNAWEKQFLHRAQVADFPAFAGMAWTAMMSALVYVARAHVQSIGREDRAEYLRDRLSPAMIAGGAGRYAGWLSFMPDVIDTVLPAKYQVFNRNSGLSTDVFDIGLSPVPTIMGNAADALGAAATSPFDGEFTQREWRAVTKLLPFQTYFGVRNLLDAIGTRLPEDE